VASIDEVSIAGFSEPVTLVELRETRCASVPAHAGIYLIERELESSPQFRIPGTGGWFKGQDPNCALDIVEAKWVGGVECPALFVPVCMRETGMRGALNGTWKEAYG